MTKPGKKMVLADCEPESVIYIQNDENANKNNTYVCKNCPNIKKCTLKIKINKNMKKLL